MTDEPRQPRAPTKKTPAEPPPPDAPENAKARWFREHVLNMSRAELARASGVSLEMVRQIEKGRFGNGSPPPPETMQRYRLICAALATGLRADRFDWLSLSDGETTIRYDED